MPSTDMAGRAGRPPAFKIAPASMMKLSTTMSREFGGVTPFFHSMDTSGSLLDSK